MGVETAIAVAAVVGAGAAVYSATQKPKLPDAPKPPDKSKGVVAPVQGDLLKQKQKRAAAGDGTVLTSPLGLTGEPSTAPRTLLGG